MADSPPLRVPIRSTKADKKREKLSKAVIFLVGEQSGAGVAACAALQSILGRSAARLSYVRTALRDAV